MKFQLEVYQDMMCHMQQKFLKLKKLLDYFLV